MVPGRRGDQSLDDDNVTARPQLLDLLHYELHGLADLTGVREPRRLQGGLWIRRGHAADEASEVGREVYPAAPSGLRDRLGKSDMHVIPLQRAYEAERHRGQPHIAGGGG